MQSHPIKTILVIEDDRFIGEMYVRSLIKEGYEVDWVVTGTEGYSSATSKTYDLILLDIMLPEAQGTDVLSELRNDIEDKIPQSKVIVLTNFEQDDQSRMAMQAKADGYLIKAEITPRKLLEIIKQLN
ncbi:MAG: response regulator [Candidatus Saccharimonadales bacterium]